MDNVEDYKIRIKLSSIPILVGSDRCNLFTSNKSTTSNVLNREDMHEYGG